MKSFTSELYVRTSALTDEKICIGLFVVSDNAKFFAFSERKLRLADKLLDNSAFKNLEANLKSIRKEVERLNDSSVLLLDSDKFNRASFEYLNRYANGLLHFTSPKPLGLELNESNFFMLYSKLVDEPMVKSVKRVDFKSRVSTVLKREAFDKVDRHFRVTPDLVASMYATHTIDFIGKNGAILAGNTIDFNAPPATIDKGLFEFSRISKGLAEFSRYKGFNGVGEYVAYFEMPEDRDARKVLDLARKDKNKGFELKELDALEKTADRISKGNYMKFSEFLLAG